MRFKLPLIALLFLSLQTFSQSKNNISLLYGFNANVIDIHGAIGDYGYNNETGQTYGLSYTRTITSIFSLETGILYACYKVQLTTIGPRGGIYNQKLDMLSVPIYAKWTILRYFYGQCGLTADHQSNYTADHIVDDQSGLGISLGIGAKYNFGPLGVFVNPYFINHRFYQGNNLLEAGVKFGLGYNF